MAKKVYNDKKGMYKDARREKTLAQQVLLAGGADCYLAQKQEIAERRQMKKKQHRPAYNDD